MLLVLGLRPILPAAYGGGFGLCAGWWVATPASSRFARRAVAGRSLWHEVALSCPDRRSAPGREEALAAQLWNSSRPKVQLRLSARRPVLTAGRSQARPSQTKVQLRLSARRASRPPKGRVPAESAAQAQRSPPCAHSRPPKVQLRLSARRPVLTAARPKCSSGSALAAKGAVSAIAASAQGFRAALLCRAYAPRLARAPCAIALGVWPRALPNPLRQAAVLPRSCCWGRGAEALGP
jgi:hypothetical protein